MSTVPLLHSLLLVLALRAQQLSALPRAFTNNYHQTSYYCLELSRGPERDNLKQYRSSAQSPELYVLAHDQLKLRTPLILPNSRPLSFQQLQSVLAVEAPSVTLVHDSMAHVDKLASSSATGIPPMIHMAMKDKNMFLPHAALSIISWAKQNPGHAILLFDDADIEAYIQKYQPSFWPTASNLSTAVEKADAWRYVILCKHGGIYTDTDTLCLHGVHSWESVPGLMQRPPMQDSSSSSSESSSSSSSSGATSRSPSMYVGIENVFQSQKQAQQHTYVKQIQMLQWTLAAAPRHELLCGMPERIKSKRDLENKGLVQYSGFDNAVLQRTGPGIWTDAIEEYLKARKLSVHDVVGGRRIGDIAFLHQPAMGCNWVHYSPVNHETLVYHMFNNSWKVDWRIDSIAVQKLHKRLAWQAKVDAMVSFGYWLLILCGSALVLLWACVPAFRVPATKWLLSRVVGGKERAA
mmetsp:Transcript_20201/g.44059  ORF Transcript_20201/g.44059 Transcript_20201/m.44059 type:complete len:464 (+) Transcript_20201:225-1616(+)